MITFAASIAQVALIVVVILGLVALATWLLSRRRRDVWSQFARRRGLNFVGPPGGPSVNGRIDGRSVNVVARDSGSDQDVGGVAVVRLSVGLQGVPEGMTAEGVPGLVGDLAALAEDRIVFEQDDFNRDVLVKGNDDATVRPYWSRDRQQTFLQLVNQSRCDKIQIQNGAVVAEIREVVSDLAQLEQLLDRLLAAAPRLDANGENR